MSALRPKADIATCLVMSALCHKQTSNPTNGAPQRDEMSRAPAIMLHKTLRAKRCGKTTDAKQSSLRDPEDLCLGPRHRRSWQAGLCFDSAAGAARCAHIYY